MLGADTELPKHKYCDEFIHSNIINNLVAYEAVSLNVDAVFHLAASADVTHSTVRPSLYYHNNLGATASLFDNLITMGWKGPVIFSSTASVYGFKDDKCREDHVLKPETAYGKSKLMCENYLDDIWNCNNIPSVIFRYFNVAGGYGDVGDHLTSDHVLQRLCYSAVTDKTFNIFGDTYSTKDGSCVRDYLHVLDVCNAHFTALDYLKKFQGTHIFNLGTSEGVSVKELAAKFILKTGKKVYCKINEPRTGDPAYLVADSTKFKSETSFEYKHSNIDVIIYSAWEWYRRNNNAV